MSDDKRRDEAEEQRIEDLDVPESESDDVKGGLNYSKVESVPAPDENAAYSFRQAWPKKYSG